jgi:hypothetical protein
VRAIGRCALLAALGALSAACASQPASVSTPPLPAQARADPQNFLVVTVRNDLQSGAARAGSTPRGYDSAVQYGVGAAAASAVHALERDYGLRQVSAWPITTLHVHCIMFRLPAAATRDGLMAQLEHDPRVESVQPLNSFEAQSGPQRADDGASWMPYNDPYGRLQHSLRELAVIDAQRGTRGAGVRVAIIDTGVDFTHPDLEGRVIGYRNFVDRDTERFRDDVHGTEVAGVIAAVADNGVGIVGIAPEARLIVLKACWQRDPQGSSAACNSFTLAQALEAAIVAHADVVNLSLAGPPDPLLTRLIRSGARAGIIFVGAVGPSAAGSFPAGLDPVLPVGTGEAGGSAHELAAPGRDILTLVPGGHYDFASGSSLATAEVTGVVALLLAAHPHLSGAEVRALLERSSTRIDTPAGPIVSINACTALALARLRDSCTAGATVIAVQHHTTAQR